MPQQSIRYFLTRYINGYKMCLEIRVINVKALCAKDRAIPTITVRKLKATSPQHKPRKNG